MLLRVRVCDRQVNWKRKDLPCGCLLWTPRRYFLLPRFDWSCATSGSTWDLSRMGSWPWSAPDRRPLSPTPYHKAALSAWIGPGETWRERKGEKSYYEARCQPAIPCKHRADSAWTVSFTLRMELGSSLGYYCGDAAAIFQLDFGGCGCSNALFSGGEKRERVSFHIATKITCHVDCGSFKVLVWNPGKWECHCAS